MSRLPWVQESFFRSEAAIVSGEAAVEIIIAASLQKNPLAPMVSLGILLYNGKWNMKTRKKKIFILIRKLGNIPSPLQNCICWTQKSVKAKSLKGVNPVYMLEPY